MLAIGAAVAALAVAACGGDDDGAPPPEPDAGTPEAPVEQRDAAAPPDAGSGGPPKYRVDCPLGTAVEFEPNDTADTANAFTERAFCGVLEAPSDVDWSAFSTPSGKKLTTFQAVIDGPVDFELRVNGKTFGPADVEKFEAGDYRVKAFTRGDKPATYRYRIAFE